MIVLVYDASAKIPSGVISGNIQQLGNYDECLQIQTDQNFIAQACSASVQFEILKGPRRTLELDMKDLLLEVAKAAVKYLIIQIANELIFFFLFFQELTGYLEIIHNKSYNA
jgi:hypothetical protein